MVCTTVSLARSTQTSFGPPGRVAWNIGLPVSRIHSRSSGATTMLWTDTNAFGSSSLEGVFHAWSGKGRATPSRSSTTVADTSSPRFDG